MNDPQPEPPAVTPLNDRRYTKFYQTMLILSTISTSLSFTGSMLALTTVPLYLAKSPLYAYTIIATCIITIGAVVALILLWLKHSLGIWLKLSSYVLVLGLYIIYLINAQQLIGITLENVDRTSSVNESMLRSVAEIATYASYIFGILTTIAFAILWYFAWRSQVRADSSN